MSKMKIAIILNATIALLVLAFSGKVEAQNPQPCASVSNSATVGQVLGAKTAGRTPVCVWQTAGGGGGSGTVTSIATAAPITGGTITTSGTIRCNTCVVGPASATSGHIATFNGTTGKLIQDGGAVPTGTVTSIATSAPLGGGTITSTGTLTCTTCATSTPTNHGVAIGSATQALSFSSAGTTGQCFLSNGASADPAFTTCPSGGITPTARGNYSSATACSGAITGQLYFATDTPGVTRQCNGTSYQDFWNSAPITVPGAAAGWTALNSPTAVDSGGAILLTKATTGLGIIVKAITATTDFRIKFAILDASPGGSDHECGLWVTDGTTVGTNSAYGSVVVIHDSGSISQYNDVLSRTYQPINGSIGAFGSITGIAPNIQRSFTLRIVVSGMSFTSYTGDGQDWVQLDTGTMTFPATNYGFGCDPRASTSAVMKIYSITAQ